MNIVDFSFIRINGSRNKHEYFYYSKLLFSIKTRITSLSENDFIRAIEDLEVFFLFVRALRW